MKLWTDFGRAAGALAALVLFLALGAAAETTNDSVAAIIQGRKLALQLITQRPLTNLTQTGVLKIRPAAGSATEIPVTFEIAITPTNWLSTYTAADAHGTETLVIAHAENQTHPLEGDFPSNGEGRQYIIGLKDPPLGSPNRYTHTRSRTELPAKEFWPDHLLPFAGSDFLECDLGLEFFHWPAQKVLPKTTSLKRGREYTLLESTNPNPTPNGYSRVLSWIDKESGGILAA